MNPTPAPPYGEGVPYATVEFPPAPEERPYVYVNMVATIDGKIVTGTRDEDVMDLGSKTDHKAMANLDAVSDACLVGGRTLRAAPRGWRPRARVAMVVSASGDLPYDARYFEAESYVVVPEGATFDAPVPCLALKDWPSFLKSLREKGIERLYVLGGSELNGQLLGADLVDELFLTVAPKVRLGTDLPTYAGGEPLPRGGLLQFALVESHVVGDEVFLRYRRRRE